MYYIVFMCRWVCHNFHKKILHNLKCLILFLDKDDNKAPLETSKQFKLYLPHTNYIYFDQTILNNNIIYFIIQFFFFIYYPAAT